jgi:ribosomal protein S27E
MLKELVISLDNNGVKSNEVIEQGFDYLVKDTKIYSFYSLKLEINKEDFKDWFYTHINHEFFEDVDQLLDFINTVAYPWYEFYVEHKTLIDKTKSLKSDCKRWYKKNKDQQLKNFDRFFETVKRMFEEAYSVYDVVFYDVDAIKKNTRFPDDRGSCYINGRKDYFEIISQMNAHYIMIYRNQKPITRLWGVISTDKKSIAIFNSYGYQFKDLARLFSSENEYATVSDFDLERKLGIHINRGNWIISKNCDLDDFIYEVECPNCGNTTYSDSFEWGDERIHCDMCDDDTVYSYFYDEYIPEDQAVFSKIHDSYIYKDDAVFSEYYDDYIHEDYAVYSKYYGDYLYEPDTVRVYNIDIDREDYVLPDDVVYSSYYDMYIIKDQAEYSWYLDSYLLKNAEDTAFSKWLGCYIDINDDSLIEVNGDYIPEDDVKEYFILIKNRYYRRKDLLFIRKLGIPVKPIKGIRLMGTSWA